MHYIIQENVFREQHYDLLESALIKLKLDYTKVRIFPFVDKIVNIVDIPDYPYNVDDLPEFTIETKNVFCFGAIKLARIATQRGWEPGSLMNQNHDFEIYKNYYKENLLNWDSKIQKFSDSIEWLNNNEGFFRPTQDTKSFTGKVFSKIEWDEFVDFHLNNGHLNLLNKDTLIQVSTVKNIFKEIRFWVVNGKIVTGSQYRIGNQVIYDDNYEIEAKEFAQQMVDKFQLADAFVIDVCLTDKGWKVVESGCINCAGFYKSDIQKMLMSVDDYFNTTC
jgi:hypothetical protein